MGDRCRYAQWEYEGVDFLDQLDIPVFCQSYKNISGRFQNFRDYIGAGVMACSILRKDILKTLLFTEIKISSGRKPEQKVIVVK